MEATGFERTRPARLAVLDYGLFRVHENGRVIGICGFVITTADGRHILVDTGFPPEYADDGAAAAARDGLGRFGEVLRLDHGNLPAGQLARLHLTSRDVSAVILTHSHIDHIGCLAQFGHAPVWVAAAERALPRPLYFGGQSPMGWPDMDYRLIHADGTLMPGLDILLVPGHAPGQLALMLDLPETGPVLITGDAISRPAEVDEGFRGSWDVAQAQASGARLLTLAAARGAFVIWGHGPEQWPTLLKAPETYG